jgi:hypothetical protein
MEITHVGHSIVQTDNCDLHLNNILYAPEARKNLISVHRLALDNSAYLEFHPNFFLSRIKQPRTQSLEGHVAGDFTLFQAIHP